MPLTALKVKKAGPGKHADIHGLYLIVQPSGSRSWMLRYQHKGRRRDFGLGPVHDVPLAEARTAAMDIRKMVRAGLDPVEQRGLKRPSRPTFEVVARKCYEALRKGWKDRRNASWIASFENHVFPLIGSKRVDAIDSKAVLGVMEPIWTTIPDTANKILQRIGAVLDYAHIKGMIPHQISLRSVRKGLPRQTRLVEHRQAMPYKDVPAFMAKLMALPASVGRDALKLTVLTATRSGEVRYAVWGEFDLEKAIWSIPTARMKMKEGHIVPLAPASVALLRRLYAEQLALDGEVGPDRVVFTHYGARAISDVTMLKVLRDMGIEGITVHGFRSSFADWAAERTNVAKDVVEKALAHKVPNAVEAAYRRTDFFEKRRVLMGKWGEFCQSGRSSG
ncbi:MAG TPA: integrase arm-type DNA-binding domain-containing protein [Allosphingosinicella sp.]|jgi:integrase|nr:integrase arm-type DNA-binding domain-containing protein [Allosphingosinicella sp.]